MIIFGGGGSYLEICFEIAGCSGGIGKLVPICADPV